MKVQKNRYTGQKVTGVVYDEKAQIESDKLRNVLKSLEKSVMEKTNEQQKSSVERERVLEMIKKYGEEDYDFMKRMGYEDEL